MADHMRTELVEDALTMAFANPAPERASFFTDRGCQYTGGDFAELARANGVVLSVGRKGECWDNAVAESFFATIKRELIDRARGRHGPDFEAASSSTSRAGTTRDACTRRSATSAPPNTKHDFQRRPSGGMINTTNLSVKPGQAQSCPLGTN